MRKFTRTVYSKLTPEDYHALLEVAEEWEMTPAEIIRTLILKVLKLKGRAS